MDVMNVANLRALAQKLRRIRHEEHYNQGVWTERTTCGSVACLAGHAIVLAGFRTILDSQSEYGVKQFDEESGPDPAVCAIGSDGKKVKRLSLVARQWLGFTENQAETVFSEVPHAQWPEEFALRWTDACRGINRNGENEIERPSRIAADFLDAIADGAVKLCSSISPY